MPFAAYDFAVRIALFDRSSNLHGCTSFKFDKLLVPKGYTSFSQIIRAHFQLHLVTG